MEERKYKFRIEKATNMGRALGVGIVYMKTGKEYKNEYYLYVNFWKYNLAIGWFN